MRGGRPVSKQLPGGRLLYPKMGGGKGLGVDEHEGWQLAGIANKKEAIGTGQEGRTARVTW